MPADLHCHIDVAEQLLRSEMPYCWDHALLCNVTGTDMDEAFLLARANGKKDGLLGAAVNGIDETGEQSHSSRLRLPTWCLHRRRATKSPVARTGLSA